jgi:elongator complex protein 1
LEELQRLPPHYRRYRIDLHLKRFAKALEHLAQAGAEHFDEVVQLLRGHPELYSAAVSIYSQMV